jgi:hypothetical protein
MHTTLGLGSRRTDDTAAPWFLAVAFRTLQTISLTLLLGLTPGSAFAQSTYVGAALVGDVLRSTHTELAIGPDNSTDGEAIGFALRVGTPLGGRWGVELEFARPGEIESEFSGSIPLASGIDPLVLLQTSRVVPPGATLPQIFPPILPYRVRSTQRYSTLSTSVWFNQSLSPRLSLVYLAGMGFSRTTFESDSRFEILPALPAINTVPAGFPSVTTKTVTYGVRPLAGFEARIKLTDHADLVPGIRLHGLENAWLLRPAVGIAWNFER